MATDDDDQKSKPIKTNAGPVLKPPGLGQSGYAPPGAVGRDGFTVVGPVFIGYKDGDNPFGGGPPSRQGDAPPPRNETTPRFHETDDQDINRLYGRDHIMVGKNGSEVRPDEWPDEERPESDPKEPELDLEERQEHEPPAGTLDHDDEPSSSAPGHHDGYDPLDPDDELDR